MPRSLLAALLVATLIPSPAPAQSSSPSDSARWRPRDVPWPGHIALDVDATDVERGIFRVTEKIPLRRAGRLTLLFPTWVPGNHAATARVDRLAGLVVRAGDKRVHWARDPVDMHAFHVDVPSGVTTLDVQFEYLSPTSSEEGRVLMTPVMLNLQWFSLVLYPAGHYARQITVDPAVRVPDGWQITTQLDIASRSGSTFRFMPVDLEVLIDSPIFAGRNFRRFSLGAI